MKREGKNAFTLIELLVVVAIIAILAAIAIPNFLEAQTRSKVSRAKSDLRTVANAVEMYTIDSNHPPFDGNPGDPHWGWVTVQSKMTTPIAYITTVIADVFQDPNQAEAEIPGQSHFISPGVHSFDYSTAHWEHVYIDPPIQQTWLRTIGQSRWKLVSCGPDRAFMNDGSSYGKAELYDPTNGTLSFGDIVRSQAGARGG